MGIKMKYQPVTKHRKNIARIMKLLISIFFGSIFMVFLLISKCHAFDFSNDYLQAENWPDIVFRDNWSGQDFCRCPWGLRITDHYESFQKHQGFDTNSEEYKILSARTDTGNIRQIALSPDGRQILYVENIYRGSGITDDEDVYYRVYNIEKDSIITIYEGHKEFLLIDWK